MGLKHANVLGLVIAAPCLIPRPTLIVAKPPRRSYITLHKGPEVSALPGHLAQGGLNLGIGIHWDTPDGWLLHRVNKRPIWIALRERRFSLKLLAEIMMVKESWIELKIGSAYPPNYPLLKFVRDSYQKNASSFGGSLLFRAAAGKAGILLLTLYKEDTAYAERIGGMIQNILDNAAAWQPASIENRTARLKELRNWWYTEDWRQRFKDRLAYMMDWIIEGYEKDPFITRSLDYVIDLLLANQDKWVEADKVFRPCFWYPRGRGHINYLCHGRIA